MDLTTNTDIYFHWLANTPLLLQRACVVVVVTYIAIHLTWFRQALQGSAQHWQSRLILSLFMGFLAIMGTHLGIVVDIAQHGAITESIGVLPDGLAQLQAIISFRDTLSICAGLVAGPWVGLGTGLIAGTERYLIGSFVGFASGFATALLGLLTGLVHRYWPNAIKKPWRVVGIVLLASLLQKTLIVGLSLPHQAAFATILETMIPETLVNCLGCLLFLSVINSLERDQLAAQTQQAELRALRAQIEPHFINNVLNGINALVNGNEASKATAYIVKLARFLDATRETARVNVITLGEELERIRNYNELQELRFPRAFSIGYDIPADLLGCYLPPHCLLTPVINALLHGRRGGKADFAIRLTAKASHNRLILTIEDNGCGIAADKLKTLGFQPVQSERGSGNGLYQLQQSLRLAFSGAASMAIASLPEHGVTLTIHLPQRRQPW